MTPRSLPRRDETGFTLVELLIVLVILPILIGGIGGALVTVLTSQTSATSRFSGSHDAQVTSSYFVRDIQSSWRITTNTTPLCGSSALTQVLGVESSPQPGGSGPNVSYVKVPVAGAPTYFTLVRFYCANGASTVPTAQRTATVAHLAYVAGNPVPTVKVTCPNDAGDPTCLAAAGPGGIASSTFGTVAMAVTEPSGYLYSLTASPRNLAGGSSSPSPSSAPSLLLLGGASPVASCSGSGQTLTVNGVAAVNSSSSGSITLGHNDFLLAEQVYSGSATPVSPAVNYTSASAQPYASGPAIPDPEANLADPSTAGQPVLTATSSLLGGPGVYTNAVSISDTETINPGIYIFERGLSISGSPGTTLTGTGVMFFIGMPNAAPSFVQTAAYSDTGNGGANLTAPTSGTYRGIVIFQARTDSTALTIAGNGSTDSYSGQIYAPDAVLSTSGNGITLVGGVVAAGLTCGGNGIVTIGPPLPVGTTTTAVTSSPSAPESGQSVSYTATIGVPSGALPNPAGTTVTFSYTSQGMSGLVTMCSAVAVTGSTTLTATCAYPLPASGSTYTITATYSGNSSYQTSTGVLRQGVGQGSTSTTLTSSVNPSVPGQLVTYTAKVSPTLAPAGTPTGNVEFLDGTTPIAGCTAQPLNGANNATCAVLYPSPGVHTITGIYLGDSYFFGSTSSPLTETVAKGATTTSLTSATNPSVPGQVVTYTAVVAPTSPATGTPAGTVQFLDGGTSIAGCTAQALNGSARATCAVSYGTPGSHTITAQYSGDSNFFVSTSSSVSETVTKGATTTALTSSLNPSTPGQPVIYTATVAATLPASGTPTGTVGFFDSGIAVAGCTARAVLGGQATCTQSYAMAISHSVTAVYSGDTNFSTSTSSPVTQVISQGATTTAVTSSVNPSVPAQAVTYRATVSATPPASGTPTGTIKFLDGATVISGCTAQSINGSGQATCAMSYAAPGPHTITAVYSGDTNFSASSSSPLSQTVSQGATTTVMTSSVNPSVPGQPVTYTATVSPSLPASGIPTGNVEFLDGSTPIPACAGQTLNGSAKATCTQTYGTPLAHTITAQYLGDTNFSGSTSSPLPQTVVRGSTTSVLSSSLNPSTPGQLVTYTAAVTPTSPATGTPTGSVEFFDGAVAIPGCTAQPLNGSDLATCGLTYGSAAAHTITSQYLADTNFSPSTSSPIIETVGKWTTTTSLTSSLNPATFGNPVTYTATVTATASGTPTGSVEFLDGATAITACANQPLNGVDQATCAQTYTTAGPHSITAIYLADATFAGSTSPAIVETVSMGVTTAALTSSVNSSGQGQSVTYTATVATASGTPTGGVQFLDSGIAITGCASQSLSGSQVAACSFTYTVGGIHTITAQYLGDSNFSGSTSAALTQTVRGITIIDTGGPKNSNTDILSGTTEENNGTITVRVYDTAPVLVKTYTVTTISGTSPSFTWTITTAPGDLSSNRKYTAQATQVDAAGNTTVSVSTPQFKAT